MKSSRGVSTVEYVLMLCLIVGSSALAVKILGGKVNAALHPTPDAK